MSGPLPLVLFFVFLSFNKAEEPYRPQNGIPVSQASFSPPFSSDSVPFWEVGGSALVHDNKIRLTPSEPGVRGWIWATKPIRFRDWESVVQISIGSHSKVGADGMGIWFTKDRVNPGPIVGNTDRWEGIGVIVDTFDNNGQKDHPQIYALYNDNNAIANPATDGKDLSIGMCRVNIRQVSPHPEYKTSLIRIRYKENVLTVYYDISELIGGGHNWVECFSTPTKLDDILNGYYMGVTAETGGLTDYHDVMSVTTWSLRTEPDDGKEKTVGEMPYLRSRRTGLDPNTEIVNRVLDLDKKEELFTNNIDSKFNILINKLQTIETDKFHTLVSIESSLDSMGQSLDIQKLQDIKNYLRAALLTLGEVQTRISVIEEHVEGTYQKANELSSLHSERSSELLQIVEEKGNWGFWTYFMVFQIFVWLIFVWWRGKKEEKKEDHWF